MNFQARTQVTLTDEQCVVLFFALREIDTGSKSFIYGDLEDSCRQAWGAMGRWRSGTTWVRACQRAKEQGFLGRVLETSIRGRRYRLFTYSATVEQLINCLGDDWSAISDSKRKHL